MSNQSPSGGSQSNMVQELWRNAGLALRLLLDPNVSPLVKLIPAAVLVYVISPIDLIPDVIPIAGQLDDLAIILLGIRAFIAFCPPELVQRYRNGAAPHNPPPPDDDNVVDGSYKVVDE